MVGGCGSKRGRRYRSEGCLIWIIMSLTTLGAVAIMTLL